MARQTAAHPSQEFPTSALLQLRTWRIGFLLAVTRIRAGPAAAGDETGTVFGSRKDLSHGDEAVKGRRAVPRRRSLVGQGALPDQMRAGTAETGHRTGGDSRRTGQSAGPGHTLDLHKVAASIGGNQFQDLSGDLPDMNEWRRAQEATEEVQPTRHRLRQKRAPPGEPELGDEWDQHMQDVEEASSSSRVQRPRLEASFTEPVERGECWWQSIPDKAWPGKESSYLLG